MEIFELKNYGKIEINLKTVMDKKGISKNRLSKLDVYILARICFVLECDISDLIKYRK